MALDEASAALFDMMVALGLTELHTKTPQEARDYLASLSSAPAELAPMAKVKDRRIRVSGGAIPLRLLVPNEEPEGVILWFHGGGWVLGSIDEREAFGRALAAKTGCAVVLVGYRLAPEYRFPTAIDDAYAALCWVDRHLEEFTGKRVPVVVGGDSAGANLAAVAAIRSRDYFGPKIDLQVLACPVVDCDPNTMTYRDPENDLVLSRETMAWFWDQYAPDPESRINPDASPLKVPDTSKLPPAVVVTAEHDVLRAEGEIYATRMVKSDVRVQHRRFAGQMHNFLIRIGQLEAADQALEFVASSIRAELGLDAADVASAVSA